MKKNSYLYICILVLVILLGGMIYVNKNITDSMNDAENEQVSQEVLPYSFKDALGNEVVVNSIDRVVILYGSFTEAWINGGGSVVGTTEDAITERNLELDDEVRIVGTVKEPNLEEIIAVDPTFVILSADIENHKEFGNSFEQMGIPYAYMRIDVFEDYLDFLKISSDMNRRSDLYEKNGLKVSKAIDKILDKIPKDSNAKILFLRAYSSGAKAKTDDNFVGIILEELGTENIAKKYPSLLEDLSIETIIEEDPDYIFVTTMGNEENALRALKEGIESNPAWNTLKAVKNDRYIVLPKDLFHYKPNARWAESYEYLAKIIYPQVFE